MIYNMPGKYGAVKRCNILQDKDSFKRNLNLYIASENTSGHLVSSNATLKQNLKTWLTSVKMINDTIDILDARIVNLGLRFEAILDYSANRFDAMNDIQDALEDHFEIKPNIGQSFFISDIYNVINDVPGVVDVVGVDVFQQTGAAYATTSFVVQDYLSADGRVITFPPDFIWEIRYPKVDIKGTLK